MVAMASTLTAVPVTPECVLAAAMPAPAIGAQSGLSVEKMPFASAITPSFAETLQQSAKWLEPVDGATPVSQTPVLKMPAVSLIPAAPSSPVSPSIIAAPLKPVPDASPTAPSLAPPDTVLDVVKLATPEKLTMAAAPTTAAASVPVVPVLEAVSPQKVAQAPNGVDVATSTKEPVSVQPVVALPVHVNLAAKRIVDPQVQQAVAGAVAPGAETAAPEEPVSLQGVKPKEGAIPTQPATPPDDSVEPAVKTVITPIAAAASAMPEAKLASHEPTPIKNVPTKVAKATAAAVVTQIAVPQEPVMVADPLVQPLPLVASTVPAVVHVAVALATNGAAAIVPKPAGPIMKPGANPLSTMESAKVVAEQAADKSAPAFSSVDGSVAPAMSKSELPVAAATVNPAAVEQHVGVVSVATPTAFAPMSITHDMPSPLAAPLSGVSPQEPAASYSALEHQSLIATPNVVEIGVANGTHGWLRIRAELQPESGQVNAAVVAGSSASVETLHRQLPAMAAYLATEQVNVASIVVSRSDPGSSSSNAGLTNGGAAQQQKNSDGQPQSSYRASGIAGQEWTDADPSVAGNRSYASAGGSWLNVHA